jgi:DNA-binding NarL/FixJ family response regulator
MKMPYKNLTCVLVDDEVANLEILANYIQEIPHLVLKAAFNKPIEALAYLLKNPTDLLITDINMPQLSGIDLYIGICNSVPTQVVFVSSCADEIIKALDYCVTDYLHKPVSFLRFEKATQKAFFFSNINKKNFEDIPTEILEKSLENYHKLSDSEKKILKLISEGKPTQKISELVFTSMRTIESHRYTIRKKLGLFPDISLTVIAKFIMESVK